MQTKPLDNIISHNVDIHKSAISQILKKDIEFRKKRIFLLSIGAFQLANMFTFHVGSQKCDFTNVS